VKGIGGIKMDLKRYDEIEEHIRINYVNKNLKETPSKVKTLAYFLEVVGRMPNESQMRKECFSLLKLFTKGEQKERLKELRENVDNALPDDLQTKEKSKQVGWLWSARYIMGDLELKFKIPFRKRFSNFVSNKRIRVVELDADIEQMYRKLSGSPLTFAISFRENKLIKRWLDESDQIRKDLIFS